MNGPRFFNDSRRAGTYHRRTFLLKSLLVMGALALQRCLRRAGLAKSDYAHIKSRFGGPDAAAGHLLRDAKPLPAPQSTRQVKTLIVGAGIAGLSAARWLKQSGETDFEILDLEQHTGGNSFYHGNAAGNYPLGAHYLPIPNNDDELLLQFLKEHDIITGFDKQGLPLYDEYALCFDPEERLLINGEWQEGLVPDFGVPAADKTEIGRFFQLVNDLKKQKGLDGRWAFTLPVDACSADDAYTRWDKINFREFLDGGRFHSPYLRWYLEYCCKDDYGTGIEQISAWAGLHYFCSRKGRAANAPENAVLTWPEGNGRLMENLKKTVTGHIHTGQLATEVRISPDHVDVLVHEPAAKKSTLVRAEKIILATPQFVNQRLLKTENRNGLNYGDFVYNPWLVATLSVQSMPYSKGLPLCWDNVAFGLPSVGYVNANQQDLDTRGTRRQLTYYLPLAGNDARAARLEAYGRSKEQWLDIIMPEMEKMHPGIADHTDSVDIWLWGHGMIRPSTGFIWGSERKKAAQPVGGRVFFAHSDLGGISVFEEAFHAGIRAAKNILG